MSEDARLDQGGGIRELGNKAFRAGDYKAAEAHYTTCMLQTSQPKCKELALSNRQDLHCAEQAIFLDYGERVSK